MIPLADARSLRPAARITSAVLLTAAAAAVALGIAFLLESRHPHTQTIVPLPAHADTVLVLDLSASISSDTYSRIGGTLAALSRSGRRFGLVVFSDQAYEALPPGTPSADLAPFVRYFTLPPQRSPGFAPAFPPNPWGVSGFSGGTRISAGMELAHRIAASGGRHATVVLVSDLDDNPNDLTRLATVMLAFRRDHVPVRIVGLNPEPNDVALFQRLTQPAPVVAEAPTLSQAPPQDRTPFPWLLVALALALAAVLAAGALWAPRLDWGET
ncbi:MAG TPA: vWA domain-containing protein [Gaiellaceae bacterium]|nr:vWA domain-containing protein [Gaiellaceae bacterium]